MTIKNPRVGHSSPSLREPSPTSAPQILSHGSQWTHQALFPKRRVRKTRRPRLWVSCMTKQMADSLEYPPFLIIVRLLYRRRWTVSPCRPRWGEISTPLDYNISSPSPNGCQHADAAVPTFPPSRFLRGFRELGRPIWGSCPITFTTLRRDRSASISPACGNHFNGRVR
jgi:hypothetical protein